MRIRQVRPEFFTDPVMAGLSAQVRLTYIGLWCVADDAGWLRWDVQSVGAVLYPYEMPRRRVRHLESSMAALVEAGRIIVHECGCAEIPTLAAHQKIGGMKATTVRDWHLARHAKTDVSGNSRIHPPVTLGNGKVGNGTLSREASPSEDDERMRAAWRRQGLPVD